MFDHKIYNVADPVDMNDVSNKKYVDDTVVNLNTSVDSLENKTQNINSTSTVNTITKTTNIKLDAFDAFNVSDLSADNPIF